MSVSDGNKCKILKNDYFNPIWYSYFALRTVLKNTKKKKSDLPQTVIKLKNPTLKLSQRGTNTIP